MKKILLPLVMLISCCILAATVMAETTADSVLGIWLVPKEDGKVTIYKCGEKFCGKVTWLKKPEDLDTNNPDPEKKKLKILGMNMLWDFTFKNGEWSGGQIYDPDTGNTYKCKMWLKSPDKLNVKGYVGIPLFGRSEIWTRVK
jgi:uncharacterized protein (DUF2147 family)